MLMDTPLNLDEVTEVLVKTEIPVAAVCGGA